MSGDGVDRTRPPEPGSLRPFHFPDVTAGRLGNGLEVRVARMARLPLVSVKLVLPAGESRLGHGRAGLAVLTGDALEGGTRHRSGAELAEALERLGANLSVSTGWDATTVSLSCMADRLADALPLLAETVLEPAFPADEVERTRSQRLARIQERLKDPGSLAHDAAARFIYADDVPYARPLGGTVESVEPVGPDDARALVDAHFLPLGAGAVVVGDVDADEVEALLEAHFGAWDGEAPPPDDPEAAPRSRERRVHLVHRPGAVQSELRLGHVGVSRTTDDYFPLTVVNTVLGGSFTSRLNRTLREEKGYTYGVRSRFAMRRGPGPFTISTAVESEVTADAVAEALRQVETLLGEGPTDEEVESARDYTTGVFPLRLETTGQVAGRIAELLVYGLPDDYWSHYREGIRGVPTDEALAAARRRIRPDEMAVVVVGDADEVRASLEARELGPVEVHEPA